MFFFNCWSVYGLRKGLLSTGLDSAQLRGQGWTQPSCVGWADVPARSNHGLVTVHEHNNQLIN